MENQVVHNIQNILTGLPDFVRAERIDHPSFDGYLLSVSENNEDELVVHGLSAAEGAGRRLCLCRDNLFWMQPDFSPTNSSVPHDTQFMLWERTDNKFGLFLPLIDCDMRTTCEPDGDQFMLVSRGTVEDKPQADVLLAFTAIGFDPYVLIREAAGFLADRMKTFRTREQKRIPQFMDWLGWCTWDAFYREVDAEKILTALDSFSSSGIQPGFVILDDGWMLTDGVDNLEDFEADTEKFPKGLSGVIAQARAKNNIKYFGIWHALTGYWAGVNPGGELYNRFRTVKNKGCIHPWEKNPEAIDLFLIHPKDIHRFYDEFYVFLRSQGVDFVKCDGQSSLEVFTEGKLGRVRTMTSYQHAMQASAAIQFNSAVVNCMSHGSDVLWNMLSVNVMRNSNDYFPEESGPVQQRHLLQNAFNSVFTSVFCFPDWDMFQTGHAHSEFHAAARAVSGGPVYISDKPGEQNNTIIKKLCLSDGQVLRCSQPALPSRDCLFSDCHIGGEKMLKIINYYDVSPGRWGVLGFFHCHKSEGAISGTCSSADFQDLEKKDYAVWSHFEKKLLRVGPEENIQVALKPVESEILTFAPIDHDFAVLGLIEKYNPAAAIMDFSMDESEAIVSLKDGGLAGFYSLKAPGEVLVDGMKADFKFDKDSSLLTVNLPEGNPSLLKFIWDCD